MRGLAVLMLAVLAFVGSHVLLSSTPLRAALVRRLGEGPFLGLYSTVALATIVWVVVAYGQAPYLEIWPPAGWTRWIPLIVMPVAAILFVGSVTTASPTAVGGERLVGHADPAPGILKVTRHPMMWAFALWAAAHIPANGDLASLMLFGGILGLALAGPPLIDRKRRSRLGGEWDRVAASTSNVPFLAVLQGRARLSLAAIGWWRIGLGLLLFLALLVVHPWLFGASPLP
jgi:uncharacterized membrane protein